MIGKARSDFGAAYNAAHPGDWLVNVGGAEPLYITVRGPKNTPDLFAWIDDHPQYGDGTIETDDLTYVE